MQNTLINSINSKIKPHLYESVACGKVTRLPKVLLIPEEIAQNDESLKERINEKSFVKVSHISEKGLFLSGVSVLDNSLFCSWDSMNLESVDFAANEINEMY